MRALERNLDIPWVIGMLLCSQYSLHSAHYAYALYALLHFDK
jgi:hypothetical protein